MIDKDKKLPLSMEESDLIIKNRDLGIARIMEIINRLTDKTNGCPWDLIQTNSSLAKHTIEEAYEIAESIESQSPDETRKELGDLLFNILFHIHLGKKNGLSASASYKLIGDAVPPLLAYKVFKKIEKLFI